MNGPMSLVCFMLENCFKLMAGSLCKDSSMRTGLGYQWFIYGYWFGLLIGKSGSDYSFGLAIGISDVLGI